PYTERAAYIVRLNDLRMPTQLINQNMLLSSGMPMVLRCVDVATLLLAITIGATWLCSPSVAADSVSIVWQERAIAGEKSALLPAGPVWFRAWLKVPDNMAGW